MSILNDKQIPSGIWSRNITFMSVATGFGMCLHSGYCVDRFCCQFRFNSNINRCYLKTRTAVKCDCYFTLILVNRSRNLD